MRLFSLFLKSLKENIREWKILILTLVFASFFVYLYYLMSGSTSQTYKVLYFNLDQPVYTADGSILNAGQELIQEMMGTKYSDGKNMLKLVKAESLSNAREQIKNKTAEIYIIIPGDFSGTIARAKEKTGTAKCDYTAFGDPSNPNYIMAGAITDSIAYQYTARVTGMDIPVRFNQKSIADSDTATQFDLYIPSILVLSLIMVMFTASASIIKEVDKGTILRLRLSKLTTFEFLASISLVQVIISFAAMAITYVSAVALGFKTEGSTLLLAFVGLLSSLSVIAVSLIVASFLRTIFDLMTIGCFPFFILMFFSGGMLPLPSTELFKIGSHPVSITSILPTSHAVTAMNRILNYKAGFGDVSYEICSILLLTVIYFAIGVWLFKRRHMRTA